LTVNPEANGILAWDSTGANLINLDPAALVNVAVYATAYADVFVSDGVDVTYTLSRNPGSLYNLDISVDGVTQEPVRDYTLLGTVVTFTSALPINSRIVIKYKEGLPNVSGDSQDIRYVPAGSSTVRTVQAKLRETVSVKDFGAVGDGVTDDTLAIQAALDSVDQFVGPFSLFNEKRGGTIYVPPGRYVVSSTLTLRSGTVLIGSGEDDAVFLSTIALGNVFEFLDGAVGTTHYIGISDLAVVQDTSVVHAGGAAISISNGYAASINFKNVKTLGTYVGIYLDSCLASSLENVISFSHVTYGFRTRINTTSTTFSNCYAGACGSGGFLIAGSYISLVGCASDNHPSGEGYNLEYDGGSSRGLSLVGCGTEACNNGFVLDRAAFTSLISPTAYIKAGGSNAIRILGSQYTTITSPNTAIFAASVNPIIFIASSGGIGPIGTSISGLSNALGNWGSVVNDFSNLWASGDTASFSGLYQDNLRLGPLTPHVQELQKLDLCGNFPTGAAGGNIAYGQLYQLTATKAYGTIVASAAYQPKVNAPGQTIVNLVSGTVINNPTVTAGTVTRMEGARVNEITTGSNNANMVIGTGAFPITTITNWSVYNASTRPNYQGGATIFGQIASAAAPNGSLFVDSADGVLKFKNSAGVVNALY
jgi:hypothetical protein